MVSGVNRMVYKSVCNPLNGTCQEHDKTKPSDKLPTKKGVKHEKCSFTNSSYLSAVSGVGINSHGRRSDPDAVSGVLDGRVGRTIGRHLVHDL